MRKTSLTKALNALDLNPFVITEEQLLANFTDADDAIADLSVVNLIADSGTLTETSEGGNSFHQKTLSATSTSPSLSLMARPYSSDSHTCCYQRQRRSL